MIELSKTDEYMFSLFNPAYIDYSSMEFIGGGKIILPIIKDRVPNYTAEGSSDKIVEDAREYGKMMFIYNAVSQNIDSFTVEHMSVYKSYMCYSLVYFLDKLNSSESQTVHKWYDVLNDYIGEKIKQCIRELIINAKGKFVKDLFVEDTYFQLRVNDNHNVNYIISKWWEKISQGKIEFIDLWKSQSIYIAKE